MKSWVDIIDTHTLLSSLATAAYCGQSAFMRPASVAPVHKVQNTDIPLQTLMHGPELQPQSSAKLL